VGHQVEMQIAMQKTNPISKTNSKCRIEILKNQVERPPEMNLTIKKKSSSKKKIKHLNFSIRTLTWF
jgi:hypothetical protein